MGGNALKNTFTRRYESVEYFDLVDKVIGIISTHNMVCSVDPIEAYREKTSFGDADILYVTSNDVPLPNKVFQELFAPKELVKNGEVTSLDVEELQVDFIHTPGHSANYANCYFQMNDLGNLIGKLAHSFGLKHGHRGLFLPLRDGDNKFDSIELTIDHDRTLEFLGLDIKQFHNGFDNLDQIFKCVSSSPYFNPEAYAFENLTAVGRIRDRKRDTYKKFVQYCVEYTGPSYTPNKDKTVYLQKVFEFFPEAYTSYKASMARLAALKFVKGKFNGTIVSKLTGLKERDLGVLMKVLKNDWHFSNENIIYLSSEKLEELVLELFSKHKGV